MKSSSCIAAIVLAALLTSLGCASRKNQSVQFPRKIQTPPPAPARREVPLDPALAATAREQILTAAAGSDPLVRAHAIEAMREAMGNKASPEIIAALGDQSPIVRFAATLAAGELRLRDAREPLYRLTSDPDASVRVGVRFALHRLGDTRLSHDLEKTSRDPSPRTRGDTAMVLGLLGEKSATRILIPMLYDRSPAVRLQAAESLWRLGSDAGLEPLVGATISKFADDQMIALLALAAPRDTRVTDHVRGALTSDYEEVNLVAARAMGMLGSDDGYGIALNGAKSTDPRQRHLAAMALAAIGRSDSQETLAALVKDPHPDVRLAAASAILQLGANVPASGKT